MTNGVRFLSASTALVVSLLSAPASSGASVDATAVFRVETGAHFGGVTIDGGGSGRYLASGGSDGVVRVRDSATGNVVRTYRRPLAPGTGPLQPTGAPRFRLSPVNDLIAISMNGDDLHVASIRTGSYHTIPTQSLTGPLGKFRFSEDARFLIVGLWMFPLTSDGRPGAPLKANGLGRALAWRLLSDGGFHAIFYDDVAARNEKQVIRSDRVTPGGVVRLGEWIGPQSFDEVMFSPDGSKILAYTNSDVYLFDATSLKLLFKTRGATEGLLRAEPGIDFVAWDPNGTYFFDGGMVGIRRFAVTATGARLDARSAVRDFTGVAPLTGGRVGFVTSAGRIGVLAADLKTVVFESHLVGAMDYPGQLGEPVAVACSDKGFRVAFHSTRSPAQVYADKDPTAAFRGELDLRERSIRFFDHVNVKEKVPPHGVFLPKVPARVRGGCSVPDAPVRIVALEDSSIRWYGPQGREVLTVVPLADRRSYVAWTPDGYYDASPGAEDSIGWVVPNGTPFADFYPASRFREKWYRPDLVATILEGSGGVETVGSSPALLLPPVVEITAPAEGMEISTDTVTIRFRVRTPPGEPVTSVRAFVDGRPAGSGGRGVGVAPSQGSDPGATRELTVPMPAHDTEVSIIAENRNAASVPATVHLRWARKQSDAFVIKPKLYVLAIGITTYANEEFNLRYSAKDATDFAAVLLKQKGSLYRDVVTRILTNDHATKDAILDGLDWITKETTSKDVAAVLISGHGVNDSNGRFYYLPYNADVESLKRTGLPSSDVQSTVAALAGKTLFFVDACHSGNIMRGRKGVPDLNGIINELASAENGAVVFAASSGNQYSLEDPAWGNGAFTKAVVEGLSGKAAYATGSGKISINMLDLYISERVKELTKGRQTPTTAKPQTIADFPVAVVANE